MLRVSFLLLLIFNIPSELHAEQRIALLIGNQGYSSAIGRLANPHNDVGLLEKALKTINFEVHVVRDAGLSALHLAVNSHVRRVRAAGANAVGFLYYSGHGAQDATTAVNYIIPIDATSTEDTELWDQSLRLNEITRKLKSEADNATHFVVIDACRNALKLKHTGSRALAQSKGFVPLREERGMLIAYATAEGELASDTGSGSGPYAQVLAEEIVKPGIEAVTMFRRVQLRVRASIGQEPWLGFGALGEVNLGGTATFLPPLNSYEQQAELAFWATVKDSNDRGVVQTYLVRYPHGSFSDVAFALIEKLQREEEQRTRAVREEERKRHEQVAALANVPKIDPRELTRSLQFELKRIGCFTGQVNGQFDNKTRDAVSEFGKITTKEVSSKEPTIELVKLVRTFERRVCPLQCATNERPEGEQCVRIVCVSGQTPKNGVCPEPPAAPAKKGASDPGSPSLGSNCFTFQGRHFCQ